MSADAVWLGLRTLVLDLHDRRAEVTAALSLSFVRVRALRMVAEQPLPLTAFPGAATPGRIGT